MTKSIRRVSGSVAVTVAVFIILIAAILLFFILCRADDVSVDGCDVYDTEYIIAASGIERGVFLYSVDKDTAVSCILRKCPIVKEAEIYLRLPDKVIISIIEEPPTFSTRIGVSTVMFSHELRVSEVKQNSTELNGIPVILPEISEAIGGKRLVFTDGEPIYVTKLLEAVSRSSLIKRITEVDCTSSRGASATVDGKYKLVFGGIADIDVKLSVALEYLQNDRIAAAKSAVLDLTSPKEVIVTLED